MVNFSLALAPSLHLRDLVSNSLLLNVKLHLSQVVFVRRPSRNFM